MKKIFSLLVAMMAMIAVNAQTTVTLDFSNPSVYGYENAAAGSFAQVPSNGTIEKDGVVITVTFPDGKNGARFYANQNTGAINLRFYVETTITIAAPNGKQINSISLAGSNLGSTYLTGAGYNNGEWSGAAASVELNCIKSTVQVSSMTVVLTDEGSGPIVIQHDTISVADARARIDAGTLGACYVMGRVDSIQDYTANYHNVNAWLSDLNDSTLTFEAYKCFGEDGSDINSLADCPFAIGDVIYVYAKGLKKFGEIYEADGSYYAGKPGENVENVALTISAGEVTPYTSYGEIDFSFTTQLGELTFAGARHTNFQAIAGTYNVSDFEAEQNVTLNGVALPNAEGFFTLTYVSAGVYNVNIAIRSTSMDVTGANVTTKYTGAAQLTLGAFPEDNTNIDCAKAAELCGKLASGAQSDITYTIYGYVARYDKTMSGGDHIFYMSDDANDHVGTFYAYGIKMAAQPTAGQLVKVVAQLKNYNGTLETGYGSGEVISEIPSDILHGNPVEIEVLSVAEALEVGNALVVEGTGSAYTSVYYTVKGYVVKLHESKANTWFMADEADATYGDFQAYNCTPDFAVEVGDYVAVSGKIQKFVGDKGTASIEISNGTAVHTDPQGIQNVNADVKVMKVMENGQLIIIRNGIRYNVAGAAL